MKRQRLLHLAALIALAPSVGFSQEDLARQHIEAGLALAVSGDSAAALLEFRQAVEAAPDMAEAHFQLGRLLGRQASGDEFDFRQRLEAQRELLLAWELDPKNPLYLAEYGRLRIKQHMEPDGAVVLGRARDLAEAEGDSSATLADIEYGLGLRAELQYEKYRNRRIVPYELTGVVTTVPPTAPENMIGGVSGATGAGVSIGLSEYVEWYLSNAPPLDRSGWDIREQAIEHYRNALRKDPTHLDAGRRLMVFLVEDAQLVEFVILAERLAEAHPDRPEADLYLGLALHEVGREDEANSAFERALARMTPEDRAPFFDLRPVMRQERAETYGQLDDVTRQEYEKRYWRLGDPLLLTEANERRLEHWARVAFADLRYSEPSEHLRGWQTDRGVVYIRYGPPTEIARVPGRGSQGTFATIIWVYGDYRDGRIFMFRQNQGFLWAPFAGDYEFYAEDVRYIQPVDYSDIPSIPGLYDMPIQVARFRGESEREVAVEVHSELPLDLLARDIEIKQGQIETGLFLLNEVGESVVRQVDSEVLEYAETSTKNPLRSWRLILPAVGRLMAAVEARDMTTWRAGVARDTFTVSFFPDDSLALSDVLLANALRPLAENPLRRTEFDIEANPSRAYAPNQPVTVYYELYGLRSDGEGFGSYEVSLAVTLKSLNRDGTAIGGNRNPLQIIGVLADAWGFSPVGDDRLELRFTRELDMKGRDRATEYHTLDLQEAPAGQYEITLQMWDLLGQQVASRQRTFWVVRED